jgi:hypothetical protein
MPERRQIAIVLYPGFTALDALGPYEALKYLPDGEIAGGPARSDKVAAHGAADWLCLAAAPTFAIMALLTCVLGGRPPDMLCSAAHDALSFRGMVPMYLLMSAFHTVPWLKLISGRRSGTCRCCSGVRQIEEYRSRR